MKKIPLKFTALSLSLLLSSIASAEELSAKQSLDKMTQALDNLNYEIAFVQTTPANMDSFRYRHIKQDNKTYAQLVTLDGRQQEIIQRDNLVKSVIFSQMHKHLRLIVAISLMRCQQLCVQILISFLLIMIS